MSEALPLFFSLVSLCVEWDALERSSPHPYIGGIGRFWRASLQNAPGTAIPTWNAPPLRKAVHSCHPGGPADPRGARPLSGPTWAGPKPSLLEMLCWVWIRLHFIALWYLNLISLQFLICFRPKSRCSCINAYSPKLWNFVSVKDPTSSLVIFL